MSVKFNPAVEKAIQEVCPPRDAFDASNFDPVEYLNSRFPDENSLSALPAFLDETSNRLRQTEDELLKTVELQSVNAINAEDELKSARKAVTELYNRISNIKTKASENEETVKELCEHIRELDIAKTNLTTSISTLRSIQLWMMELQTLSSSFEKKLYVKCRDALEQAQKYYNLFEKLSDVPKVKELRDKQSQICRQIEYYVRNTIFGNITSEMHDESTMAEACAIINLIGTESIAKIREMFIDRALETYALRFKRGTDDARLERTERRYVFIRGILQHYDSLFRNVFPRHWCVPQELCVTFCIRTKEELDYQLHESANSIDVVVLMYVLQKTIDVERDLTHMMAWKDEFPGKHELPVYKYNGLILSAFKEHMWLFVQNEDKLMSEALSQPITGDGENLCCGWDSEEEEVRAGVVLPMAEDIFVFIKESLKRSLRIAQTEVLLETSSIWRKHLIRFSERVQAILPEPSINNLEIRRACIIINTAELCQTTSEDLGEEIRLRTEASAKEVGFNYVVESFSALYSKAISAIIGGVEQNLQPLLRDYSNGDVATRFDGNSDQGIVDNIQDESRVVRGIISLLHNVILTSSVLLNSSTLRFLLDKLATFVIPRYTNALYRMRCISDAAVGVMRIDSVALEKAFLNLPNYNDPARFKNSQLTSYIRLVKKEFDQFNRTLKVLQVDARVQTFMDVYYEVILPENRSIQNFVRLVELKGLRREQVRQWIATLSKRGVVEATPWDLQREAALGINTGASNISVGNFTNFSNSKGIGSNNNNSNANGVNRKNENIMNNYNTNSVNFSNHLIASANGSGGQAMGFAALFTKEFSQSLSQGKIQNEKQQSEFNRKSGSANKSREEHGRFLQTHADSDNQNKEGLRIEQNEETLGTRFANAARNTATSINFFNKFKKNDIT